MSEAATRTVRCPACGGPAIYGPQNPWRPFCCERCRHHDLGAWAAEDYRVGAAEPADGVEEGPPPPAPPAAH